MVCACAADLRRRATLQDPRDEGRASLPLSVKSRFYTLADRISRSLAREVADAFRGAVQRLQGNIDEAALRSALASGNLPNVEAAARAGMMGSSLEGDPRLRGALLRGITQTGHAASGVLSDVTGLEVQFNVRHPNVVLFARERAADLVRQVSDQVKEAIRVAVSMGADVGATTAQQAKIIREVVGLPPNWAGAPLKLRQEIAQGNPRAANRRLSGADKARIRKRIRDGTVNEAFLSEMETKYSRSLLNRRAQNIARTETVRSANYGQQQSWVQARDEGVIPSGARRIWIVTLDDRLEHFDVPAMNEGGRAMDEAFETPEGAFMHPPSRTNCRCGVGLTFPGQPGVI